MYVSSAITVWCLTSHDGISDRTLQRSRVTCGMREVPVPVSFCGIPGNSRTKKARVRLESHPYYPLWAR